MNAMTDRMKLPTRRRQRTRELVFEERRLYLSVGFHPTTGQPLEIFVESDPQGDAIAGHRPKVGASLHLHPECWNDWSQGRRNRAQRALAAIHLNGHPHG